MRHTALRSLARLALVVWVLFTSGCSDNGPTPLVDAAPAQDGGADGAKQRAATPTFSPPGGTYATTQTVTIASATKGARIYYTPDGNEPTRQSILYTSPINVSLTQTIRAIAVAEGYDDSEIGKASYEIENPVPRAATPTISPAGGTFTTAQQVTLATTEPSAQLLFTLDGTVPTSATATVYTAPFTLAQSATVTAVSRAANKLDSQPATAAFSITITPGTIAPPSLAPAAGEYTNDVTVSMSSATAGATICYTTDGTAPICTPVGTSIVCAGSSMAYATSLTLTASANIKAAACRAGDKDSQVTTAAYTLRAAAPTVSAGGEVAYDTQVTVTSATTGGSLLYSASTDGTTPADPSVAAPGSCSPSAGSLAVPANYLPWLLTKHFEGNATTQGLRRNSKFKFRACKTGYELSSVTSSDFTVKLATPTVVTTAGTDSYAFGTVNDRITPAFAQDAVADLSYGASAVGTLCVTNNGATPVCNIAKTGCTTGTPYAAGASTAPISDNTQNRNLAVAACKPNTVDSNVLSGSYVFQLRVGGAADPGTANLAPGQAPLNIGTQTITLKALKTESPATPGSAQLALGPNDSPAEIVFYYTTNGTDPTKPALCGDPATAPTIRLATGGLGSGTASFSTTQTTVGTNLKVLACTTAAYYNDSAVTPLSWAAPGQLGAPTVTPATGTYYAPFNTTGNYVKITKNAQNPGANLCFTQNGADPYCGNTTSSCIIGTAVAWPAASSDVIFDATAKYTVNGTTDSTLPVVDDNTKSNFRVMACTNGTPPSAIVTGNLNLTVADPTPQANGALNQGTPTNLPPTSPSGITWRYTVSSTPATCSSPDWGAVDVPVSQTFPITYNLIGCKTNWTSSNVVTRTYTSLSLPVPTFSITSPSTIKPRADGSYPEALTVQVATTSTTTGGGTKGVCFTTDGSQPTCGSLATTCTNGSNFSGASNSLGVLDLSGGSKTYRAIGCQTGGSLTGVTASTQASATYTASVGTPLLALTSPPAALVSGMRVVGATWTADAVSSPTRTDDPNLLWSFDAAPTTCTQAAKISATIAADETATTSIPVPKDGTVYVRACKANMSPGVAQLAVTGSSAPYTRTITSWANWSVAENEVGAGFSEGSSVTEYVSFDATNVYVGGTNPGIDMNADRYLYWLFTGGTPSTGTVGTAGQLPANLSVVRAFNSGLNTAKYLAVVAGGASTTRKLYEFNGTDWIDNSPAGSLTAIASPAVESRGLVIPRSLIGNPTTFRVFGGVYGQVGSVDRAAFYSSGARIFTLDPTSPAFPNYTGSGLFSANGGRLCWTGSGAGANGAFSAYCP